MSSRNNKEKYLTTPGLKSLIIAKDYCEVNINARSLIIFLFLCSVFAELLGNDKRAVDSPSIPFQEFLNSLFSPTFLVASDTRARTLEVNEPSLTPSLKSEHSWLNKVFSLPLSLNYISFIFILGFYFISLIFNFYLFSLCCVFFLSRCFFLFNCNANRAKSLSRHRRPYIGGQKIRIKSRTPWYCSPVTFAIFTYIHAFVTVTRVVYVTPVMHSPFSTRGRLIEVTLSFIPTFMLV